MPPKNPNVAVVVLDTLRKDAFDEYFNCLSGRRFKNGYSPGHWTLLGEHGAWDYFYGAYPDLTHVPLVVSGPASRGGTRRSEPLRRPPDHLRTR